MSDTGITNKQLTSFLDGRWHSGNGYICVGTFRIARADFEFGVLGTTENQNKFIDKMADRLNNYSVLLKAIEAICEEFGNGKPNKALMGEIAETALYKVKGEEE